MPHKRITLTIEDEVVEQARRAANLIPMSRWVESLIVKELEQGRYKR
jgi:post-segregation antitoxin (ccd killing protein)